MGRHLPGLLQVPARGAARLLRALAHLEHPLRARHAPTATESWTLARRAGAAQLLRDLLRRRPVGRRRLADRRHDQRRALRLQPRAHGRRVQRRLRRHVDPRGGGQRRREGGPRRRRRHDGRGAARRVARQQTIQPHERRQGRARRRHPPHPRDDAAPPKQGTLRRRISASFGRPCPRSTCAG